VKKLSKNCHKIVKNKLGKIWEKFGKKLTKRWQKVGKKLAKSCQKVGKKENWL
jgi:hypothetical protein